MTPQGSGLSAGTPSRGRDPRPSPTRSAITPAIASDEVAPGDGALRTWTTPSDSWNTKSSSSVPSGASACARMPDGPGRTSETSSPGRSLRADATKRRVERSRTISPAPIRQCCRASRRKPASGSSPAGRGGKGRGAGSPRGRAPARRSGPARPRRRDERSCGRRGTGTPGPARDRRARAPDGGARAAARGSRPGTARCAAPAAHRSAPRGDRRGRLRRRPRAPPRRPRRRSGSTVASPRRASPITSRPSRSSPPAARTSSANASATRPKSTTAVSGECSASHPGDVRLELADPLGPDQLDAAARRSRATAGGAPRAVAISVSSVATTTFPQRRTGIPRSSQ